jgi:hypothetical protein
MDEYRIEWKDAERSQGWEPLATPKDTLPIIRSIGYLVEETREYYGLSQSIDNKNNTRDGVLKIPKGMVVKKRKIRKI